MKGQTKIRYDFIILALIVSSWIVVLFFISPEEIVAKIGIEGGYLLVFLTALIGISSFTSASYYTTIAVLASTGEFHPLLFALVAAPAAAFGDSLFFFLGIKSRSFFSRKYIDKFSNWVKEKPEWMMKTLKIED